MPNLPLSLGNGTLCEAVSLLRIDTDLEHHQKVRIGNGSLDGPSTSRYAFHRGTEEPRTQAEAV
jgi:hypothetical protein